VKKTLLVCSKRSRYIEQRLNALGHILVKATSGETAVARMHRETFDAAVIVSTGRKMDLLETVFNLKDIGGCMPIFAVRSGDDAAIGHENLFPYIRWFSLSDLESVLRSADSEDQPMCKSSARAIRLRSRS
jgi:hypothetical protein